MIRIQELMPATPKQIRLAQQLGINCDAAMSQALVGFYIRKAIEARRSLMRRR